MPKATEQYNLQVVNPGLSKEWHPTRNGDLNPRNVTPGSGKKVWWICVEGHEWEATIYSRNRGSDCPTCNKPTLADNTYLLVSNTDLVKEWHLTKNRGLNLRNLPPDFNQKVWWLCEEGHEWKDTIKGRIKGKGCPDCNKDLKDKSASRYKKSISRGEEFNPIDTSSSPLKDILGLFNNILMMVLEFIFVLILEILKHGKLWVIHLHFVLILTIKGIKERKKR